ncbi:MarR family winged helix-turn-helix transcriptional regulator [Nocardia farcinica]|uniref:MarR family winged helix-turn-helix transcriptional regulator n=1 Tax=Nocardia farcinica TaxID=37329 RepID=UPI002458BD27|nr:MarR family transcriptional regulator [Nocardia farcinica]
MTPDDLTTAVMSLHREIAVLYAEVARQYELTSQQTQLLCLLGNDPPSFGTIAARLGCDKTNVTGMVDRLSRRGLLAREPDPTDRRVSRVVLTREGDALRREIRDTLATAIATRLSTLIATDPTHFAPLAALINP